MARPPRPPFLAPSRYRQKRVRDAARLLPVAGAILLLVPLLWTPSDEAGGIGNSTALLYVFGVWILLVLGAFGLARALRPGDEEEEP